MKGRSIMKGGANETEPYKTYKLTLDAIYDYFSVIFVNNNTNNEKYKTSVDNLDKPCDCSKYKCKKEESEGEPLVNIYKQNGESNIRLDEDDGEQNIKLDEDHEDNGENQEKTETNKLLLKKTDILY